MSTFPNFHLIDYWINLKYRNKGFGIIALQVPVYVVAQLTGAISASFTLAILLHPIKHIGTTSPSGTQLQALVMEMVVTFSMMFITSAVATDTKAVYVTLTL